MSGSDDISTGSSINLVFSEEEESFLDLEDSCLQELYNCETDVNFISASVHNSILKNISKAPVTCVIKKCNKIMSGREVLTHFLHQHREENHFEIKNVTENEKCVLAFDYKTLPLEENVCLGVMAYKGSSQEIRQSISGLSMSNISLPKHYQNLTEHLPVLIIGCLTYSSVLYSNKEQSKALYKSCQEKNKQEHRMLCIWLASPNLTKPLYATMKVKSKDGKTSLEMVTSVRNFSQSHDVQTFVHDSTDTLNMSNGFLKRLAKNFQNSVELELCLYEYDI